MGFRRLSRRFTLSALALVAVLGASGCSRQTPTRFKREYRMQVTVGPTTHWGMGAARFAELAAQKTGGRINVKPYYGSQLLKGAQLNSSQMVSGGAIDCALESTINTAPVIPEMNLFSLPFFIDGFPALDRIETGETGRQLSQKMAEKGLVLLAWGENGFRQLTNSKRAVATPEELKGLKVRVVGSPLFIDIFRAFGADPVNMNWGDAVTAFQQGTVDGQENPVGILTSVQIHQYHKFATFWNYVIDPLILYWNKKEWDAFPEDVRQALRDAAEDACRFEKALARVGLDDGTALRVLREQFKHTPEIADPVAHLTANGVAVRTLNPAERDAFAAITAPVTEAWTARIGSALVATAKKDMAGAP
jgi:tripartite ATP-independent transporter DctP family solute receptor